MLERLLSKADSLTKKGDTVTITSKEGSTGQISGQTVTIAPKVSFSVSVGNGTATLSSIKGLKGEVEISKTLGKVNASLDLAKFYKSDKHTMVHLEGHYLLVHRSFDFPLD